MSWCQSWLYSIVMFNCFLCFLSCEAVCFSNEKVAAILNKVQTGDENGVLHAFVEEQNASLSFTESYKFLSSLVAEINAQYKLNLTKSDACRLIRENLCSMQLPLELQSALLTTIEQIEREDCFDPRVSSGGSYQYISAQIDLLGWGIYWPWEWNWFGWNKNSDKTKTDLHLVASAPGVEFELPAKMAAGFMCVLGGALICIIPGGQGVGLTLIGTGIGLALDGMANGERPYYVDSATGQRIP